MMSDPLSAENFSQLYASLETLDITQIVSTLLSIAPLRDEIQSRLWQTQPRARRKRRTRAEMEALSQKTTADGFKAVQLNIPNTLAIGKTTPVLDNTQVYKKKSRKGMPAKLNATKYSHLLHNQMPLAAFPVTGASDSGGFSAGTSSPGSNQSDAAYLGSNQSDVETSPVAPTVTPFRDSERLAEFDKTNLQSSILPFSYWNSFRLATSHLLYNYSNMMLPSLGTDILKSIESNTHPFHNASNHTVQNTTSPQTRTNYENKESQEEPYISIVDEEEESEKAEDLTTKRCAESPGSSVTTISTSAKEQNTTQQLTEINCPDCGVSVVLSDLTSHLQNECSNQYSASKKVSSEVNTLSKANWELCTICYQRVPEKNMLKHIKQRHSDKNEFRCEICNENFRNKSTLKRHKITHTSGGGHACSYCAKIFAKPELLRRHELLHTEVKRILWPCSKCDKSFSNKYNLAVHDRMHTGELPFPCPHCPEKFRVKCSMQNHIKSRHPQLHCRSPSPEAESLI